MWGKKLVTREELERALDKFLKYRYEDKQEIDKLYQRISFLEQELGLRDKEKEKNCWYLIASEYPGLSLGGNIPVKKDKTLSVVEKVEALMKHFKLKLEDVPESTKLVKSK